MAYQLKTMNIKGKSYVLVNERIIAFRKVADFKGFALETELLHIDDNSCVVRATIKNEEGRVIAQGMAQEDRSSSMINKTSFVENCETSAVGRALGFLGIGVEDSIATAEEVEMAIAKQDAPAPAAAPAGDVFSRAVDYIKGGKTKPERNTRLENTLKKYGDSLNQDQQNTLYELV
jgi:hypothetical protein